eukprot:TRINITY_DN4909_c0_g1_i1.p1 TRINITY_DN4909_c0_g1~~TRINITY_DN4909_c0_g1_i1.p1  ORF type:complete len:249 (-),score=43.34 TRINITY_DN4909_c0_g1_i1:84-830(-)
MRRALAQYNANNRQSACLFPSRLLFSNHLQPQLIFKNKYTPFCTRKTGAFFSSETPNEPREAFTPEEHLEFTKRIQEQSQSVSQIINSKIRSQFDESIKKGIHPRDDLFSVPKTARIPKFPHIIKEELEKIYKVSTETTQVQKAPVRGKKHALRPNQPDVPPPRDGLNVRHFLARIGNDCAEHCDKFSSWEELMTVKTYALRFEKKIPTKQRKWILSWINQYRLGVNPPHLQIPPWKLDDYIKEKYGK